MCRYGRINVLDAQSFAFRQHLNSSEGDATLAPPTASPPIARSYPEHISQFRWPFGLPIGLNGPGHFVDCAHQIRLSIVELLKESRRPVRTRRHLAL